jgi:hypothetical protein
MDRMGERLQRAVGTAMAPCCSWLEQRVRNLFSRTQRAAAPLSTPLRAAMAVGALAVVSLGVVPAAAAQKATKDPLAENPRLAQKVKVTVEGLPVGEVLGLLAAKTGIPLAASREIADDKVIILGPARPLREVLADLAALFNDRWERKKAADHSDRYVLIRDLPAQRYEAALANAVTARMMAQLAEQVRALDETPEQLARRPENDPVRLLLSDEVGRLGTLFYAALSREQREALFASRHLNIPFGALAPEHQGPLREAFARRIAMEQELARQVQEEHPGRRMRFDRPEDLEKGLLRFRIQRTGGFVSVGMALGAIPLAVHVDADDNHVAISGWPVALLDSRAVWLLPPHGNPYSGEGVPASAPLPAERAIRAAAAQKSWPDWLRNLAETAGVPLMADYYRGKPVARPPDDLTSAGDPDPPAAALDTLCQPAGFLWWLRGKTLLLRKRDWFQQQLYEVPDRWMVSTAEHLKTEGGIPTVADALRVLELTSDQIAGLDSLPDGPWVEEPDALTGLRELLAIVQASPRDKTGPLPVGASPAKMGERSAFRFSDLTPGQRCLLLAFLDAQDYPAAPADALGFSVRLSRPPRCPEVTGSGYRYAPVEVEWSFGSDTSRRSLPLDLPASLPEDRRDRTKVEVVP